MVDEDFNELEYQGVAHPACPSCDEEIPDVHNGGDPASWWNVSNIPDCDLKYKCGCGQEFRINVEWSPVFSVVPIEHDHEYENDYSALSEA